jgi:hypothetical protein
MTISAKNLNLYFSGTVKDKLVCARQLFTEHESDLMQQKNIRGGIAGLRRHEAVLDAHMGTMQMGSRCSACATKTDGGCCSSYMAGNTDAILLLINLIMGINVSIQHTNDIDCCFLGSHGCILSIKPIFCLNYNCTHIQKAATSEEMRLLDKYTGALLSLQTKIEGLLLELINRPISIHKCITT